AENVLVRPVHHVAAELDEIAVKGRASGLLKRLFTSAGIRLHRVNLSFVRQTVMVLAELDQSRQPAFSICDAAQLAATQLDGLEAEIPIELVALLELPGAKLCACRSRHNVLGILES